MSNVDNSQSSGLSGGQSSGASVEFVGGASSGVLCRYVDRDVNGDQIVVHSNVASWVPSAGDSVDVGGVSYCVSHRSWSFAPCGAAVCTIKMYRTSEPSSRVSDRTVRQSPSSSSLVTCERIKV